MYKKHKVKFHWIRGHNEHPQNERCDQLAVKAAQRATLHVDEGFEALYEGLCMALDTIYSMRSELDRTRYETISMAYQIAGPGRVQ